jgi:serine/threonine protein kinase
MQSLKLSQSQQPLLLQQKQQPHPSSESPLVYSEDTSQQISPSTSPSTSNIPNESNKVEFKLINQGGFGCIYSPEISCDGKVGNPNYISKIQLYSNLVTNEINIGKKIANIHNYEYRYSPILSSCPANIDKLGERIEKENCKILESINTDNKTHDINDKNKSLISTKIRYIAGNSLDSYLDKYINYCLNNDTQNANIINPSLSINIIIKIATIYVYLLESLQKMTDNGIIHFDIKEPNIIFDSNLKVPIIIDFGISFIPSEINTPEKQKDIFYTSKFYPYWAFDIFILNFIVNNVRRVKAPSIVENENFTMEKLNQLLNTYVEETNSFLGNYSYPLSTEDIELFKLNQTKYYERFKDKKWEDVFIELFKPEIYNTWDNFSLAYMFFSLQKNSKMMEINNANADDIVNIWKSIILSDPIERKTVQQTIEEVKKINILEYKNTERQPMQPVGQPMQPVGQPMQPVGQPMQPVGQPMQPVGQPMQPVGQPMQPVGQPMQPVGQPMQPVGHNKLEMIANLGAGAVAVNEIIKNMDNVDEIL